MMFMLELLLFTSTFIFIVTSQAPGDESELCTVILPSVGQNVFVDPPNLKPLMDSSHYENFLPPNANPVWQRVDNDDNNPVGQATTWSDQGPSCRSVLTVCGFPSGPQDNWLITQHINTSVNGANLPQVAVRIEYQQTSCSESISCQRLINLLKYETSSINPAAARTTTNYALVTSLTTQATTGSSTLDETVNIDLNSDATGFYFAVRDTGTCILISRVVVYYHICPSETVHLVERPETIAPRIGGGALLEVTAKCVPNSSPANGESPRVFCREKGLWFSSSMSRCVCDIGFTESGDNQSCVISDVDCGELPPVVNGDLVFTNTSLKATAVYSCDSGFVLEGESIRTCMADGLWSGEAPVCTAETVSEELKLNFKNNTPSVFRSRIFAEFESNRLSSSLQCHLTQLDCSSGQFEREGLPSGKYVLRIVARDSENGDTAVASRRLFVPNHDIFCSVALINRGVVISGNQSTIIEFSGVGKATGYQCILDRTTTIQNCVSPIILPDLSTGRHRLVITPEGCGTEFSSLSIRFNVY